MSGPFEREEGPCLCFRDASGKQDATLVLGPVPRVVTAVEAGQLQSRAGPAPFPMAWDPPCQISGVRHSGVPCSG